VLDSLLKPRLTADGASAAHTSTACSDASDDPMQETPGTMTSACQTDPVKEKKKPQRSKGVQTKPREKTTESDYQRNSEPDMDEPVTPIHKEKKFIVFMTCLTRLLSWCHCPDCGSAEGRDLVLGGDGRADSPGHCAKFGSYTMLELHANVVIDVQLVQSNECGGSYHMEKTGLERSLAHLERQGLAVGTMVTDRHRQIAKWLRETYPHIEHLYDIWHVAKGFSKKLLAASNERECQVLRPWIKSVSNHMYWCAVSTPSGQGSQIVAKWESVVSHVQNVHTGHGDLFPSCIHGRLEGRESHKKWLEPSSKAAVKLETLVCNKTLCNDISKLSGGCQTSAVEGFHSLLIQFAPKMYVFSYTGMLCRILIAALHFNENSNRVQGATKAGEAMYSIKYPKGRKGAAVLRRVLESPTYEYAQELLAEVVKECTDKENVEAEFAVEPVIVPLPLCAEFSHPEKADFVKQHLSRFKK
ncbi:hypothetical protein JOQ06_025962, partial [Pogonophryne albipinna]